MLDITGMIQSQADKVMQGIENYLNQKKADVESYFGISLDNNQEYQGQARIPLDPSLAITLINDIPIDKCYLVTESLPSDTADHTLDNNSQISEAKIRKLKPFSLDCMFTQDDHREKVERLKKLDEDTSSLVSLYYMGEITSNLAIVSIDIEVSNVLYTKVKVNFKEQKLFSVKKIPAPEAKKVVGEEQKVKAGKSYSDAYIESLNRKYDALETKKITDSYDRKYNALYVNIPEKIVGGK